MTIQQEDALFNFLDNMTEPFDLEMVMAYIRLVEPKHSSQLADELKSLMDQRRLAFSLGDSQWISRRGFFEGAAFVITPSRLELLNGILIPGHRCAPFANPGLLPQEYSFTWKGTEIPFTTTEGEPEEFYPYYSIFGEEYAPQYVARDNPENESAFNVDPYEDPPEVSIKTLDMRNIYRECSFVPGDRFVVKTVNWLKGIFSVEKAGANDWNEAELYAWFEAAEIGFRDSFRHMGPCAATEEQIAYAYWYGGRRMLQVPAYSLEEFLYIKTEEVEIAPYGIETRFWYTGREIPDLRYLEGLEPRADRTNVEKYLCMFGVPLSEAGLRAYLWDSVYRQYEQLVDLGERIIPPDINMPFVERDNFEEYLSSELDEMRESYSPFLDKAAAPIRQRFCELHTAVVELAVRVNKEKINASWLPTHTFIILSQIQSHAAAALEDLDAEESPSAGELEAMDNSLDSMIETYEDIKSLVDESFESFRMHRFSLVRSEEKAYGEWLVQLGIGGTEVWRRVVLPEETSLEDLHRVIQSVFAWNGAQLYQFSGRAVLDNGLTVGELGGRGLIELLYEYGTKWTVKVMFLSREPVSEEKPIRCVAGAGAAPPETVGGPLRFRRFVAALDGINTVERAAAERELGPGFDAGAFDAELCNRSLAAEKIAVKTEKQEENNEN